MNAMIIQFKDNENTISVFSGGIVTVNGVRRDFCRMPNDLKSKIGGMIREKYNKASINYTGKNDDDSISATAWYINYHVISDFLGA